MAFARRRAAVIVGEGLRGTFVSRRGLLSVKVLVVGAGGQVARALLASAPDAVTVTALSRAELDITDIKAVETAVGRISPAVIINGAAYTAVDRAENDVENARKVNADGACNLATAALRSGARLLHLSTDFVFDGASSRPYRPDSPTNPLNVYGATKRAGEEQVLQVLPERSVVLRTAWIYAADGRNFVRTMLRLMGSGGVVRVVADQVGSPTAASSVAAMLWKLAGHPEIRGIHHWTDAGVASWYDFAVAIAEEGAARGLLPADVTVSPITTPQYPTPAQRPPFSVLDRISLAHLGVEAPHWRRSLRGVLAEIARA